MSTAVSPSVKRAKVSPSHVLIYVFLTAWALTTIFPFLWIINASLKPSAKIMSDSFSPSLSPIWDNYINAFSKQDVLRAYGNSLLVSGIVTIVVMLLAAMVSFAMTRYKFRGKAIINSMIIGSLMFPIFSTIIPVFRMMFQAGLLNNPLGVILPQIAGNLSFAIIVMTGFFKGLPIDLEEAAFMEGCNVFQIFAKVILPISRPSLATVAIFTFLWSYNDLFTQLIIIRNREWFPICALLNEISSKYGTDYGLMAASVTLIIIPVLIVYILLQKHIVKGLTAGAIKG